MTLAPTDWQQADSGGQLVGPSVTYGARHGLPGLFRETAVRSPDAIACADPARELTYRQLDELSDEMAERVLTTTGRRRGVIALRIPRGVDRLVALLGVLKAGCCYLPVALDEPEDRVVAMAALAAPLAAVTAPGQAGQTLTALPEVPVPAEGDAGSGPRPLSEMAADQPVYVLFTSGSTGTPKGVLLGSAALVNRILWMDRRYRLTPADRVLQKTPYIFDVAGWEFFWPIVAGARCVFPPEDGHRDPDLLGRIIAEEGITVCHFVPSMLREFLRHTEAGALRSLRHVFCSGEVLPAGLAARFHRTCDAMLHNLYGPTEAAIDVTHWTVPRTLRAQDRVLIGAPVDNTVLRVVDRWGEPVAPGTPGGLWIGGVQVALGYLGQPELTEAAFPVVEGERYYRTGDLVEQTPGGLAYLGRLDEQVKVRGVRVEVGEVEAALSQHPAVAAAVVVAVDLDRGRGVELLAAVAPAPGARPPSALALRGFLATQLPAAYLPSGLRWIDAVPLGRTGKADRARLRELLRAWWSAELRQPARADGLRGHWWRLLPHPGTPDADELGFLDLGGNSLLAARLVGLVHDELGVTLPMGRLLRDNASLAAVSTQARAVDCAAVPAVAPPAAPRGHSPLTPGQRGLWLASTLRPDSGAHNVTAGLLLRGEVSEPALRAAVSDVVSRHDALRARVADRDGRPEWRYAERAGVPLTVRTVREPLDDATAGRFAQDFSLRPFALSSAHLLRVGLLRATAEPVACLVVCLHHLIADQRTLDIVLSDLALAYAARRGGRPPEFAEAPRFEDYAWRVADAAGEPEWAAALAHWRRLLHDGPRRTALPFRFDTEDPASFHGHRHRGWIDQGGTGEFTRFVRRHAVTPAAFVLACLSVVLSRWSDQDRVVLGVPASRRRSPAEHDLVGFLIDTLPVRIDLAGRASFRALLDHVRDRYVDALQHNAPPFDAIVAELGLPSRPSVTPVFQVWVNDLTGAEPEPEFPGLAARFVEPPEPPALFDLNVYLTRSGVGYRLDLVRAVDRYPAEVADALLRQCLTLIEQVVADPARPLDHYVLDADPGPAGHPEGSPHGDSAAVTVDGEPADLVERVLVAGGDRPAATALVTADGAEITYGQLLERVMEIGERLRAAGAADGAVIGLLAARTDWFPAALLGIWRAGCVAGIVDSALPPGRVADCHALLRPAATLRVTPISVELSAGVEAPRRLQGTSHVLFTSGTSGTPAAVAVRPAPVAAAFAWYAEEFGFTGADRVALLSGLGHDPVLRDVLVALSVGGTVVIPSPGVLTTPPALLEFLAARRVTVLHGTPALLALLVAAHQEVPATRLTDLRLVVSGGATLTGSLVAGIRGLTDAELVNAYGTTETPQIASFHRVRDTDLSTASLPVGHGVPGTDLLVVAANGSPAAVGECGEVVVRGRNVAAGYLEGTGEPDRFESDSAGTGARTFRTGDLGRRDPDGRVHVSGRCDRQVSRNGFRLALEEVESVALRHRAVLQTAAALVDTPLGERLTLRVVARPGTVVTAAGLREHLGAFLPAHAVPATVDLVARLNTDANHKVRAGHDRPAAAVDARGDQRAPWTDRLGRLLTDLLGREVGLDDNFFDLGLTSISLLRLHGLLRTEIGVDLPMTELFRHTTVSSLARFLVGGDTGGELGQQVARLRAGQEVIRSAAPTRRDVRDRIYRKR